MAKNYGSDIIVDPPDADNKTPVTAQGQFKRKVYGLQDKQIRLDRWKGHLRAGKFPQELE